MHESACKLIYNKFLFQVYEFLGVPDPAKHSHAPAVLPRDGAVILSYGGGNGPDDLKLVFETAVKKYNVVLLNITQCLKGRVEGAYATVSKFNIDTLNACMHEYTLSVKTEVLLRMFKHHSPICHIKLWLLRKLILFARLFLPEILN